MTLDPAIESSLRARFNPPGSALRQAQLKMLDILVEVDRICRRNNISYWLSSGTLIGAARHGGFIPWDDDIDIEMLLPDYKRFCSIAPRELPHYLKLQNSSTDPMFLLGFSKVRNTQEKIISNDTRLDRHYSIDGFFIDIFPIAPSAGFLLHKVSGKLAYWGMFAVNKSYDKPCGKLVRYLFDGMIATLKGINNIFSPCFSRSTLRHLLPSTFSNPRDINDIMPLGEIAFEGHSFMAPADIDSYLKHLYGNWTALPPLDSIKTHTRL